MSSLPYFIFPFENEPSIARNSHERLARESFGARVIPYQGIIEPISTVVLTVLPKEGSRNSELEQEPSAHRSSTDLRR